MGTIGRTSDTASGIQRRFVKSFLFLLLVALHYVPRAQGQILTPDTMTLIGAGASGKASFTSLPDCPVNLRVSILDTNIVSVTPLTAGPVTALLFTVTGLQVGNTVVRIDFTGTSPPCTNTGSRFLTVHVIERPVIIQQPTSQSVAAGTDVTFTVVATGNLLRYQWRLNGVNLLGATSDTLTVANVQPTNAGDYSVAVYNAAGVVNSDSAKLTVTNISTLPFADNFDGPGNNISDPTGVRRGNNLGATREPGEPLHAGQKATNSVWLTWRAPANGVVVLSTLGSDFDTLLAVYTGNTVTNLTEVASDNDSGGFLTSQLKFYAIAGTDYHIAVDGFHGAQGQIVFSWDLVPSTTAIPRILTQPVPKSGPTNDDASLLVGFDSAEPVVVQWFNDGRLVRQTNFPAGGSDTFPISNLQKSDVGNYRVRIVPTSAPTDTTREIFSKLVRVQIHIRGDGTVVRDVFTRDKFLETADAVAAAPASGRISKSSKIRRLSGGPARGFRGTQIFSTVGSSKDPGEPNHCGEPGGASEWYAYQPPASGLLILDTEGSDFDTVLAAYTGPGTDFESLVPVACDNDSGSNGKTSKTVFQATQDMVYYLAVDGVEGASGTTVLNYNLGVPPTLTQQPASRSVPAGSSVTLSVTATGTPGPSYQWRFNQADLSGATNSSLTITNFQSANEGDYRVVAGNFAGSVVSVPATVLLDSPLRLGALGMNGNGQFQLRLIGQGNTNYVLETSTTLTNWVSLLTNAAPNGIGDYVDVVSSNFSHRFYRAMRGP